MKRNNTRNTEDTSQNLTTTKRRIKRVKRNVFWTRVQGRGTLKTKKNRFFYTQEGKSALCQGFEGVKYRVGILRNSTPCFARHGYTAPCNSFSFLYFRFVLKGLKSLANTQSDMLVWLTVWIREMRDNAFRPPKCTDFTSESKLVAIFRFR